MIIGFLKRLFNFGQKTDLPLHSGHSKKESEPVGILKQTNIFILSFIFLFESFLFIPLDLVVAYYSHKNGSRSMVVALWFAFLSTISALAGYAIGVFAYKSIGTYILSAQWSQKLFSLIINYYTKYDAAVVFMGALLPMPIKVVTISAGFFGINIIKFFAAVLVARIIRFVSIAYWSIKYGHKVDKFISGFWVSKK